MALYDVVNGGPPNGNATDLNQIVDALKGNNDIGGVTLFAPIAVPGAPTTAVNVTTGVLTGTYKYAVCYLTGYWQGATGSGTLYTQGNTGIGTASAGVTPSAEQINITAIPVGGTGVVARILCRTKANGSTYYELTQINDNVTTVWTDNAADSTLTVLAPTVNTTGSPLIAPDVSVSGLTGATAASRYVGATASGAPSTGTFLVGDWVIDRTGTEWICTTAGSPGTWKSLSPTPGNIAADTYGADGGTANAYAVTLSPVPAALVAGMAVSFKAANTNTGASTFALNGLGAVALKKNVNQALVAGDIVAGQIIDVSYDGTYWQVIPVNIPPATTTTLGGVETAVTPATAATPQAVIANPSAAASQSISGPLAPTALAPSGLTGATSASRYVGATTSGAPASGTFAVGDHIIDQTGSIWQCTGAGTPGTWVKNGPTTPANIAADTYAADTGTASVYVVTLSPVPSALVAGMWVTFKALNGNTANSGASTLALNALGTIAIKKNVSQALAVGDILAGQVVDVQYDGTYWQFVPINLLPATTSALGGVETAVAPATAATPQAVIANPSGAALQSIAGPLASTLLALSGLTGATATSRYVGCTAYGAPTTGTFAVGDFVLDQTGAFWMCTVAGTPGTWSNSDRTLSGQTGFVSYGYEPDGGVIRIDDNDPRITYSPGGDNILGSLDSGVWYRVSPTTQETIEGINTVWTHTAAIGASLSFSFVGTGVIGYIWKSADRAQYTVSIDGGAGTMYDPYVSASGTVNYFCPVQLATGLTFGSHTISLTLTGKNSASGGTNFDLLCFDIITTTSTNVNLATDSITGRSSAITYGNRCESLTNIPESTIPITNLLPNSSFGNYTPSIGGQATCVGNTGVCNGGIPLILTPGMTTVTATTAGTFYINLPSYWGATVTSGTATVTSSPVTIAASTSSQSVSITTSTTGTFYVSVTPGVGMCTNGTGVATGSPISMFVGGVGTTVTVTTAGTFTVVIPTNCTGTAVSGTGCTVTGGGTLAPGSTTVTVTGIGTFTIQFSATIIPAGWGTVFYDNFTRSNGSAGMGWSTGSIVSNQLSLPLNTYNDINGDPLWTDREIQFSFVAPSAQIGVYIKYVDGNNFIGVSISTGTPGNIAFWTDFAGTSTSAVNPQSMTITAGTTYYATAKCQGNIYSINVTTNSNYTGGTTAYLYNNNFSTGNFGLWTGSSNTAAGLFNALTVSAPVPYGYFTTPATFIGDCSSFTGNIVKNTCQNSGLNQYISSLSGTNGIPIAPSTQYTLAINRQILATCSGGVLPAIEWFTSTGAWISNSYGASATAIDSSPVQTSVTATSPSNAAFACITPIVNTTAISTGTVQWINPIFVQGSTIPAFHCKEYKCDLISLQNDGTIQYTQGSNGQLGYRVEAETGVISNWYGNLQKQIKHWDRVKTWKSGTGWYLQNPVGVSNGTQSTTGFKNDIFYISFVGTGIDLIAENNNGCTVIGITIDNGTEFLSDQYSTLDTTQTRFAIVRNLPYGQHQVKIRNTGNSNSLSLSTGMNIDAFDIYVPAVPSTPANNQPISAVIQADPGNGWIRYASNEGVIYNNGTNSWTAIPASIGQYYNDCLMQNIGTDATSNAIFNFVGTGVRANIASNFIAGKCNISINGGAATLYDTYSNAGYTLNQDTIYINNALTLGLNYITIATTDTKNSLSGGYMINIDSFDVQQLMYIIDLRQQVPSGVINYLNQNVFNGVLQPNLNAQMLNGIQSYQVPLQTTQNLTYYVDQVNGSDSNSGLAAGTGNAFQTIGKATSMIPQVVNHTVTLNVAAGTYNETVNIQGYVGSGSINVTTGVSAIDTNHSIACLSILNCSCVVNITGFIATTTTYNAFTVISCLDANFTYSSTTVSATSQFGLYVLQSNVIITNSQLSNRSNGIYADKGARVSTYVLSGSGNACGMQACNGGVIAIINGSSVPTGTTPAGVISGGQIFSAPALQVTGNNGSIPATPIYVQTGTFTVTIATAGTAVTKTVSYPSSFNLTTANIGITLVVPVAGNAGYINCYNSTGTQAGFTALCNAYLAGTYTFSYTAIGN